MVSRSRISPTRIASGSSRSAERSALEKLSVCGPTSRWLIRHFLLSCTNSIGSSTVSTWRVFVLVEVVDHRRQRRALARAGGAGHQHQAARLERQLGEDLGRVELLERQDLARDRAEHRAGAAVLVEGVDAKARQALDLEAEVALQRVLVVLALRIVHDVVHHVVHLLVLERVDVDAAHVAVHADHRRQARRQVQVGGLVLDREGEQLRDVHEGCAWTLGSRLPGIMSSVAAKLQQVRTRIATACETAQRPVQSVTLLAVTKTFGPQRCATRTRPGSVRSARTTCRKRSKRCEALVDLRGQIEWHLIGPLQSNKTRVGRGALRLGAHGRSPEDRRAPVGAAARRACRRCRCACRSTSAAKPARAASQPDDTLALAQAVAALPRLHLRGLMAIPEPQGDFAAQRAPHHALARLLFDLNAAGLALDTLSMGMSADLEAAVAEGATIVRVGSAIFGERPTEGRSARWRATDIARAPRVPSGCARRPPRRWPCAA